MLALENPVHGLAFAVGLLPAAIVGILPTRRARVGLLAIGLLAGASLFAGGLLANVPVLAVAAIFALGVASAALAARGRLGFVVMVLALPLVGVGLSYGDLSQAATVAGLMAAGSALACAVSMLWPEGPPRERPAGVSPDLAYGIRLGAAGALAAAIGFALELQHVGWACAAALLVMRPEPEMLRSRSAGRIVAVIAGAAAAIALVRLDPAPVWFGVAAVAAIAAAAATRASRWYVTPAFTTFLVFDLLLYAHSQSSEARFVERLSETVLGVGLAYFFGLAVPALAKRLKS